MGYDAITYVIKEFWPDIHRKMNKKHNNPRPCNQPTRERPRIRNRELGR